VRGGEPELTSVPQQFVGGGAEGLGESAPAMIAAIRSAPNASPFVPGAAPGLVVSSRNVRGRIRAEYGVASHLVRQLRSSQRYVRVAGKGAEALLGSFSVQRSAACRFQRDRRPRMRSIASWRQAGNPSRSRSEYTRDSLRGAFRVLAAPVRRRGCSA